MDWCYFELKARRKFRPIQTRSPIFQGRPIPACIRNFKFLLKGPFSAVLIDKGSDYSARLQKEMLLHEGII